jgi:hypothetical protein
VRIPLVGLPLGIDLRVRKRERGREHRIELLVRAASRSPCAQPEGHLETRRRAREIRTDLPAGALPVGQRRSVGAESILARQVVGGAGDRKPFLGDGPQDALPRARETPKRHRTNYWRRMANGWTDQRRAKQAKAIRGWRPWEQSTGPRTADGRARASQNAYRGGHRQAQRQFARLLARLAAADRLPIR